MINLYFHVPAARLEEAKSIFYLVELIKRGIAVSVLFQEVLLKNIDLGPLLKHFNALKQAKTAAKTAAAGMGIPIIGGEYGYKIVISRPARRYLFTNVRIGVIIAYTSMRILCLSLYTMTQMPLFLVFDQMMLSQTLPTTLSRYRSWRWKSWWRYSRHICWSLLSSLFFCSPLSSLTPSILSYLLFSLTLSPSPCAISSHTPSSLFCRPSRTHPATGLFDLSLAPICRPSTLPYMATGASRGK